MEYLTPQDIATAEQNGISYPTLYKRFYDYGWEREKAITQPINKSRIRNAKYPPELIETARQNGVSRDVFYARVNKYGWSLKEAANTKPGKSNKKVYRCPFVATAKKNGINIKTYYNRLHMGWTKREACTKPSQRAKVGGNYSPPPQSFTDEDLAYIATYYEKDGREQIALALDRSVETVSNKYHELRREGKLDHYRKMWEEIG